MTKKPKSLLVILGILTYTIPLVMGCASHRVKLDEGKSSIESNDMTSPIQGCGHQPIVGYTYCRKMEGAPTTEKITFFAPPAICKQKTCVHGTLYKPDGLPALSVPFVGGATRQDVSWTTILGSPTFAAGGRGIYLWCLAVTFTDNTGNDRTMQTCGEIRLRVVANNYIPLNNSISDQNYVWIWCYNKWIMKMTSSGRTFIGDRCE